MKFFGDGGPAILNAPPPSIEVSRFLRDGVFVPAFFFEPPLLAFVPPGAQPAPGDPPATSGWVFVSLLAMVVAAVAWALPDGAARGLAYAAVSVTPLAFASFWPEHSVASLLLGLTAAFMLTGFLADRGSPWYLAWAVVMGAAPLVFVDPAAAIVLASAGKVLLDTAVLSDPTTAERYGLWRRWGAAGSAVATMVYGVSTHAYPSTSSVYALVAAAVSVLLVMVYRFPTAPLPERRPPCGLRIWAAVAAVLVLGFGRGALLPHALAKQLVDEGLPIQAAGLVGVLSATAEFSLLSFGSSCLGSAEGVLAMGILLSGTHLQVVCALSGGNWLFVLPLGAILQGVATGLCAMAVPRVAASYGGALAQGAVQGLELVGTAVAVLVWPYLAELGTPSFAYQLAADLLIVVGVLALLQSQGPKVVDAFRARSPALPAPVPFSREP